MRPSSRTRSPNTSSESDTLEGGHVALDGGFGLSDLGFDTLTFAVLLALLLGQLVTLGGRGIEQQRRVGVEVDQGGEDRRLQLVGPDAGRVAGALPVAVAAPAHVVAVAMAVAVARHPDVAASTLPAGDEPGGR